MPKPFCAGGPLDTLRVEGTLRAHHVVETSAAGTYTTHFRAAGMLLLTPVDPLTSQALDAPYDAR